ncbi:hypothetical protein AKH19_06055 [Pelagibacteraceae bacterium GOM-A1]|nr:hypothetical protein AKH19_06055 [Pelagibacteraceae bacterium GOM-A1]
MKKIYLSLILFFLFSSLGHATCLKTVTTALTDVQTCGASETLTVKSTGSIVFSGSKAVRANNGVGASNTTVINHGLISATGDTINMKSAPGTNRITNSGTINTAQNENASSSTAVLVQKTNDTEIVNSGTIHGGKYAIQGLETSDIAITNSGTISANNTTGAAIYLTNGTNATITNTGTITNLRHGIRLGKGHGSLNNATIINSGLIAGTTHNDRNSIYVSDDNNVTSGFNLITKGEGHYDGKILLSDQNGTTGVTFFDFTLDCSISRDQTIEIHEKQNMRVINNLCGNDTYEILDSNLNPDADNSETNGYLRIYGEDLDIDSHNKKYRSEIFLSNLNDIFNSVSEEKKSSGYYSVKKRDNIYKSETSGVTGDFKIENDNFTPFLSYSSQQAKFNNGEALDSENLAIGLKKDIDYEKFKFSVVSIFGLTQNKYLDLETETQQTISKENLGQFAAVNYKVSKDIKIDDSQSLNIEVDGKYGLRRLPTYLTSFTDGDLSVDDAVDQVLSGGFNVEYSKSFENGFVLKPYTGLSLNQTLSEKIDIVADGERKDMAHYMDDDLAVKAGLNISKNTDDFGLNFNLEFNEQNGLKDSQVSISLTKVIQNNISKKIEGLPIDPELEKLFDQLQLAKENERLAEISGRAVEENRIMKDMIIQLIKENNKLKTERNLLLKN